MKVLHLSTSDITGGAARASYRLHEGLINEGINSKLFVRSRSSDDSDVIRYKYPAGLIKTGYRLNKLILENSIKKYRSAKLPGSEAFSDDRSYLKSGFYNQLPEADIYQLHWISHFVDLPSFFRKINKPVVWTLHDMFPFTGGCHYSGDCRKFTTRCGSCPQLASMIKKDLSYQIWRRKREAIEKFRNKLIIRADSKWLASEASCSSLLRGLDIDVIHYGLDTNVFRPLDKIACRRILGLPEKSKVIVFGAPGIDNPRKGFSKLKEAIDILALKTSDLFLLSFGAGKIETSFQIPWLHVGPVNNEYLLPVIYNSGDIFVIPSLQEAFGQTCLEAMSCGVPAVGFRNAGGISDMIVDNLNGFLAQELSAESLETAICKLLELPESEYLSFSSNCRKTVLEEYTLEKQAARYISLYTKVLA